MGGAAETAACFLRHHLQAPAAKESRSTAANVHQSQAQPLGISTGGLIPRISFVAAAADGGGTRMAEEFVFIARSAMTTALLPGFEKSAQRGRVGLIGPHLDGVDPRRSELADQLRLSLRLAPGERGALSRIPGVHF